MRGSPETMSRPRISASGSSGSRERGAEGHLDLLGGALPSMREYSFFIQAMIAWSRSSPAVRMDRLVTMPPRRDHGDLGGAAADVDDHVAGGLVDRQPGADRGGHRLLDDVDPARAGLVAASLTARCSTAVIPLGTQIDQPRLGEVAAAVHLLDEVAQHLLGRLEVGDHAVLQRPDRGLRVHRADAPYSSSRCTAAATSAKPRLVICVPSGITRRGAWRSSGGGAPAG